MSAATTFYRAAGQLAAYVLPTPWRAGDYRIATTLPGLPSADVVTVCLEADRPPVDGMGVLCSIPDGQGAFTDVCYVQNMSGFPDGVGQNTYDSGFWLATAGQAAFAGTARVKVVVRLYRAQQNQQLVVFINGVKQSLVATQQQAQRDFANPFIIGNTDGGLPWPGTIYRLKLYLRELSDAECQRF